MKMRRMILTPSTALLCSGLFVSVVGCGGNDEPAKSPEPAAMAAPTNATPPEPVSPPGAATTGREGDPNQSPPAALSTGNGPAPTEAPTLTDDQIVEITHTANVGEIEQAKLAQTKAKDPRVRKLAAMMLRDHSEADTKGTRLDKKASLSPSPSSASTSLQSDAQSATESLKAQATGADFDKAYVDTQVKEHQAVLDTIDQKLVPNAKNADLKAYLADVRSAVAMHLQHAQDLQKELQK